jgi:hypothetical protein
MLTTDMGYYRQYMFDPTMNGARELPFILHVVCDGPHGMVLHPYADFVSNTFLECVALAKAEGWTIEKGVEPTDSQEVSSAYCPDCSEGCDLHEVVGELF